MTLGHPSDKKLAQWATDGKGHRAARHALHCSLCERRLEAHTELAAQLKTDLAASLTPPTAFEQRIRERLNQSLLDRETLAVLADLLNIGPQTSRLLIETEPEEENDG
jgi:hypothetical protein